MENGALGDVNKDAMPSIGTDESMDDVNTLPTETILLGDIEYNECLKITKEFLNDKS